MLGLHTRKVRRQASVKLKSPSKPASSITLSPLELTPKKKTAKQKASSPLSVSPVKISPSKKITPRRKLILSAANTAQHRQVCEALKTSAPAQLVCRQRQYSDIHEFVKSSISASSPGSMYISGAPGTGKTACLNKVLDDPEFGDVQKVCVNCMSLKANSAIYSHLVTELCGKKMKEQDSIKALEQKLTTSKKMIVIVLDEVDHLEQKNQSVLYKIFEWPMLKNSKLILIGIANALDLTDRLLPRLTSRIKVKPVLLHFPPYSKQDITAIINRRLESVAGSEFVISSSAVELLAGKVAAVAGDVRKALAVCCRAVELTERSIRQQLLLEVDENVASGYVKKSTIVGPALVMKVFNEVYENAAVQQTEGSADGFPIHQKLAVCSLLLMMKHSKAKEVQLGKLHETYSRVCKHRHVTPITQSEFCSVLEMVQAHGIITMKLMKEARLHRLSLLLDEIELVRAMQDKDLLAEVLKSQSSVTK